MEGRKPVDPVLRPIGVVHADPEADVVIQARYAPVTRGVVEIDPALSPALDGLDGFDWAWLVTFLDRAVDPRDADDPAGALRPVPFLLADRGTRTGIFASRYPARPNRVGLSLVASSASARPSSNSRASTCSTALRSSTSSRGSPTSICPLARTRRRVRAAAGSTGSRSGR